MSFQAPFPAIPNTSEESSVWMLHCACAPFSMTAVWSFRALFFVIPNAVRNPLHGCFASLSMTSDVIPSESEESSVWMLHFASASFSMTSDVMPSESEESSVWMLHCACAPFSMTSDVIPSESEESSVWMLHFASASFSMTSDVIPSVARNPVWMLHFVQHDRQ